MKKLLSVCIIALTIAVRTAEGQGATARLADTVGQGTTSTVAGKNYIDTAYPGWVWSAMDSYSDGQLTSGAGRAGGPGSYGAYTFNGTGVSVFALKAPAVEVDGRIHKIGRLRVLIDGSVKEAVAVSSPDQEDDCKVCDVLGLPAGNHVLELEPDAGWVVVDGIQVLGGPDDGSGGAPAKPRQIGAPQQLLFSGKAQSLSAKNAIVFSSDVVGFLNDITPELVDAPLPGDWGPQQVYAHSGSTAIRYSGTSTGGEAYCGMLAYRVQVTVTKNTVLGYWILPQQDNGRYVAVDLHCTDGTTLSSTAAVDQNGLPIGPIAGHGGRIPTYSWSAVQSAIGQFLDGKTVDEIWIVYARNDNPGQYRGYIDEITLYNE